MYCIVSLNIIQFGACLNPVTVGKESIDLYEGNRINHQACHECTLPYKAGQKKTKGRILLLHPIEFHTRCRREI